MWAHPREVTVTSTWLEVGEPGPGPVRKADPRVSLAHQLNLGMGMQGSGLDQESDSEPRGQVEDPWLLPGSRKGS